MSLCKSDVSAVKQYLCGPDCKVLKHNVVNLKKMDGLTQCIV